MLWLIAIGCFVAILFINAHEKDKRARRRYNDEVLARAVQAGRDQQALVDDVDELQEMIKQAREKILQQKKRVEG